MSIVYLNEQYIPKDAATISPFDRGFLFGDGVYEVMPLFNHNILRFDEHITRLNHSLSAVEINCHYSNKKWHQILTTLAEKNQLKNGSIYLQITRGTAPTRDHQFPCKSVVPTIFAYCTEFSSQPQQPAHELVGIKAITTHDTRWEHCEIKSISLLPNVLLRQKAISEGANEAILIKGGYAIEGAASNLFIVDNGQLVTPPKTNQILGGITRDLVLELAEKHSIPYAEAPIKADALRHSDEIWLTSSTKEIMPVVELDGEAVSGGKPGDVWQAVMNLYQAYKHKLMNE